MDLLDKLKIEDVPLEQAEFAAIIGIENFKQLVRTFGGTAIYIPKADGLERNSRNDEIRDEFSGYNYRELARKYNLTEVSIRGIVADIDKEIKARPIEGQISLFEQY